ncbi:MAG: hypothetical protein SOR23_06720 [Candidatus Enterosoma sp.]|nr:hypothetical protein [Bacilli bacterium]MDD7181184.1 hypothetical protein [Bacilli bacterium]MDY3047902.1 hypothetical protein [Candidatus Enterosoma sp.]
MTYTKIRMDFYAQPTKNRFYRVVLVKGDPDLFKLSVMLLTAVKSEFEHCFLLHENPKSSYVMAPFMEEPMYGYKYLGYYHLSDLPEKFTLEYDTGDGWEFNCTKYKETVDLNFRRDIIILEGAGYGILEDNIHTLYDYFNGKINPHSSECNEDEGYFLPFQFDTYGDFDLPLNIRKENDDLQRLFKSNYRQILESEKDYIEDTGVCLDDCLTHDFDFDFK